MKRTRILSILLGLCLMMALVFSLPTEARAEVVAQGYCGRNWDNLSWTLDDAGTLTISGTGEMNDYSYWEGRADIKNVIIEEGVTDISTEAFDNCDNLVSVSIPSSVTLIAYGAFYDCDSLASITIPAGVTTISDRAFYGCDNLTDITLSANITSLGMEVFTGCNSLENLTITEGVTTIIEKAFAYCSGLKSVTIPASVTSIGANAFEGCSSLKNDGVYITDLGAWCGINFENGYSNPVFLAKTLYLNNELATDIIIPDGITNINKYAFYNAKCLKSVILPDGLTTLDEYAFLNCENLTSVNIPATVTSIGSGAFGNCSNLTEIHITDVAAWCAITHYQYENPLSHNSNCYLYINGEKATDIVIPMGVTKISLYAFYGYDNLNSVILPNGIEQIGQYAFAHTGLTEITVPDGGAYRLKDTRLWIWDKAFYYCKNIAKVYHKGAEEDWLYVSFDAGNAEIIHDYVSPTHYWDKGVETKAPTCKEAGIKTFTCIVCGDSYTEEIEKLITHSYDAGVETKAPTCKEAGIKTFTCTVCDDSYTEEIEKNSEHSYTDGVCAVCGESDPDYVAPSDPETETTVPTDPGTEPTEPTEPVEKPLSFFEAIATFFENIFRILFFFLYL